MQDTSLTQNLASTCSTPKSKANVDYGYAINDLKKGFERFDLALYIALIELRRRYRRTIIGPFWTTLSVGLFIGCMSIILSMLWNSDIKSFLPYFSTGYITWILVSTIITDGCVTFISNESYLKQVSLPYLLYPIVVCLRNFLVFSHHLIIYLLVMIFCKQGVNFNTFLIIPGAIIVFTTGVWVSLLLGMLCARYRDIQQIITSVLQLAMFVTPIMWRPDQMGRKGAIFTALNPLYHNISLIRLPLLGQAPELVSWVFSVIFSCILGLITLYLFAKKYRSLIYWV